MVDEVFHVGVLLIAIELSVQVVYLLRLILLSQESILLRVPSATKVIVHEGVGVLGWRRLHLHHIK